MKKQLQPIFILSIIFFSILLLQPSMLFAQGAGGGAHLHNGDAFQHYTDSLKQTPYRYGLPFLGKKVQAQGFDIPRPVGLMATFTASQQSMDIIDLAVSEGEDSTYYYVSNFAKFEYVKPFVINANFRPDVWIFPFLNVSGLFGYFKSETDVKLIEPFEMNFTAHNEGTIVGYGLLLAGGVGPVFITLGYNQAWSYTAALIKPGVSYNAGLRVGHNHKNRKKPYKGWSVWVGLDWLQLNKESLGSVDLNTLTGISQEDKQQAADDLDAWWDSDDNPLGPAEKKALEPIKDKVDGWLRNGEDAILYYDFTKKMRNPFSLIVGAQYEFSKHWQLQGEGTITPERYRATLSLSYRFGFRVRKD